MGYTVEDIVGCWEKMRGFAWWQGKWLPLAKVVENVGEFKAGRLTDGRATTRRGYAESRVPTGYTDPEKHRREGA
jgi:hypothetical protein